MSEQTSIEWTELKGRRFGAAKSAARKAGCSVETWLYNREMGLNWCFRCRQWKLRSFFAKDKSRLSGRASQCKQCVSMASTASRYKISTDQVKSLLSAPCAICRKKKSANIDHCHKSGKVRSGLCSSCNVGLGLFSDDPNVLEMAIRYLEEHRGN